MTRSRAATFRVGLMIVAGIALFCFSIFYIGYGSEFLRRSGAVEARFHDTSGLLAGAPVSFNGLNVGAVSSIRFPRDPDEDYIVVRMWIDERAFARIHADAVAKIRTMGLLGDKYVEIGGGSKKAPRLRAGAVIGAQDPFDYEAILQQPGTQDLVSNVTAVAVQMRSLLESLNSRETLLGEIINGESVPRDQRLTLADVHEGFAQLNRLAADMDETLRKLNSSKSMLGSMLAPNGHGQRVLADFDGAVRSVRDAADSAQTAAHSLNDLAMRYGQGQGAIPRLFTDREFGDELAANLRDSSANLREILRKINSGQGTLGLLVNDPRLYQNANSLLVRGPGLGVKILNGLYSLTHPFAPGEAPVADRPPINMDVNGFSNSRSSATAAKLQPQPDNPGATDR